MSPLKVVYGPILHVRVFINGESSRTWCMLISGCAHICLHRLFRIATEDLHHQRRIVAEKNAILVQHIETKAFGKRSREQSFFFFFLVGSTLGSATALDAVGDFISLRYFHLWQHVWQVYLYCVDCVRYIHLSMSYIRHWTQNRNIFHRPSPFSVLPARSK